MACVLKRILQFNNAIVFGKIKIINLQDIDITNNCMFSWSTDMVCWTNWVNYKSYISIAKNIESDFYLRVLIIDSIKSVSINNMQTACYSVCLYNENPFLESLCGENLFNPYINLDCALQLQQQLSDGIICMLGIPIYYFRVLPNKTTADYTFKEYVMHNVDCVKQMKLMIPDGTMPSSKPKFSDLDFDWEVDWEVELSKTEFATAFGDTAFPKQRDFIYVPMMNRMWEINSAYDEKNEGLMWRSTTWKLGLIKWNEKTNVEQNNFDEFIDNLVINKYDNVFAELESNEQSRTTAIEQTKMPMYTANTVKNVYLNDSIRKQITTDSITISEKQYNYKSIVVAKHIYSFTEDSYIIYQKGYCGENGTLSFIISKNNIVINGFRPIISFGNILIETNGSVIKFGNAIADISKTGGNNNTYKDYLVICRWNRNTFSQEIVAYPYIIPTGVPEYRIRPEMHMFDFGVIEENGACEYNNDNISKKPQEVIISGFPLSITNIKLFNTYLSNEESIKESLKYTTTNESCIINDLARPLNTGLGYSVK